MSFLFFKGDVQGKEINFSRSPSFFAQRIACFQASHSGELSFESFSGLMKGTSAPKDLATFAIFSESVETITLLIFLLLNAHFIVVAIRGILLNIQRFLFFNPFDPFRAKIKAIFF